jgi:hypothetical protein
MNRLLPWRGTTLSDPYAEFREMPDQFCVALAHRALPATTLNA